MGVYNLCYAFRNSPQPRCSVPELAFSKAEIRSFLEPNGRLSATWNTSLLDLLLLYMVANYSSIYKRERERERGREGGGTPASKYRWSHSVLYQLTAFAVL